MSVREDYPQNSVKQNVDGMLALRTVFADDARQDPYGNPIQPRDWIVYPTGGANKKSWYAEHAGVESWTDLVAVVPEP